MELEKIKHFIINKSFLPVALFIVMDVILIVFIFYLGFNLFNLYSELENAKMSLESTRNTANLIKNNKILMEDSIEEYNMLLDQLIPDEESYFKVIAAFEQLGTKTGVTVESYSINLDDTTEEKLSLELAVIGNRTDIEALMRDYHYVSGRLITNEDISVSFEDGASVAFKVNLIHKSFVSSGTDNTTTVNQQDIDFLNDIKKKME